MILLFAGVAGIAYALAHAAGGDDRCAEQCREQGYDNSQYTAPINGNRAKCSCVAEDGSHVPMRDE